MLARKDRQIISEGNLSSGAAYSRPWADTQAWLPLQDAFIIFATMSLKKGIIVQTNIVEAAAGVEVSTHNFQKLFR